MAKTLEAEQRAIARLFHFKNEFSSDEYALCDYPVVDAHVKKLLQAQGFTTNFKSKWPSPSTECFELQTHNVSVHPHKDDVPHGMYFALYVVKTKKVRPDSGYASITEFYSQLGRKEQKHNFYEGALCVFDPRQTHSLMFYGEETTFMLFTVKRIKKVKVPSSVL